MTPDIVNLHQNLIEMTRRLVTLARDLSFNSISDNCLYIITEIETNEANFYDCCKSRIRENSAKTPKPLSAILPELETLYPNLYDINLYVFKAEKTNTIIEIQYYPRSSLSLEYQQITLSKEPMLHCKVSNPPYYFDTKKKFDIHWEFNTLNHRWKMFWWKRTIKKQHKSRKSKFKS